VGAAEGHVARILSTGITIITIGLRTGGADPEKTSIGIGASIAIITRRIARGMGTAGLFQTSIHGTRIAVVALQFEPRHTESLGTNIPNRTDIIVTAIGLIEHMLTSGHGVTTIIRAEVAIVAVERLPASADPFLAFL